MPTDDYQMAQHKALVAATNPDERHYLLEVNGESVEVPIAELGDVDYLLPPDTPFTVYLALHIPILNGRSPKGG